MILNSLLYMMKEQNMAWEMKLLGSRSDWKPFSWITLICCADGVGEDIALRCHCVAVKEHGEIQQ